MVTRCLSLHAAYACRHAGACCAAHWVVRAEPHVVAFVNASALQPARATGDFFVMSQSTKATEPELSLAKDERGTCVFREDLRCTLHLVGGEAALPVGCRHYPRIVRIGHDEVALTLSHYCPTAAALLIRADPIHIVRAAPPVALAEPLDGLDTRDALPPLLHPSMLTDADGYGAWEEAVVGTFSRAASPGVALAHIEARTDELRRWTPSAGPLDAAVRASFAEPIDPRHGTRCSRGFLPAVHALNHGIVRLDAGADLEERWTSLVPSEPAMIDRLVSNYLAARAFGNWIAYQGRGLRTIVGWLHACYDAVRLLAARSAEERGSRVMIQDVLEGIRHTDYVMLHTIDSQALAHALAGIETA